METLQALEIKFFVLSLILMSNIFYVALLHICAYMQYVTCYLRVAFANNHNHKHKYNDR